MAGGGGSGPAIAVTVIGCVQADVLMSPVSELPASGATLLIDEMSIRTGGAGANAALAFAEAGLPVRLMGAIGNDQVGRWMSEELEPWGLADELVVLDSEPSGLTVALESPVRDRTFLTYLGVNKVWELSMIPADKYGVGVAKVLRAQSTELRQKRRQRAEEMAQKVPLKLLFPMIFMVLPALFIVILGPGAIKVYETFFGT